MQRHLFAAAVLLLQPALVFASEAGGHSEHAGMPTPLKLTLMFINLGLFVMLMRSVALPGIRRWIAERRDMVVDALEKAARAKREAETLQAEWKQRLANLDAELEQLRTQARAEIAAEREAILHSARALAENITRDAQRAAEQELRSARDLLRGEVARQAYELAAGQAPQRLTAADQRRFVDEFLQQVSK
jgi:F-type H+-transporting ATPase subunit b